MEGLARQEPHEATLTGRISVLKSMAGAGQQLEYRCLLPEDISRVKVFNSNIFPIKYADRVYQDALACGDVSSVGGWPARSVQWRL